MRKWVLIAAVMALMGTFAWAQQKPDFTGIWKLDLVRSRLDGVGHVKELVLTIEHKEPTLRVSIKRVAPDAQSTDTLDLVTDGTPKELSFRGQPALVAAHWDQWKGNHLVIETKPSGTGGAPAIRREMIRGSKGKIMTTILTVQTASGEKKGYEFFSKE